MTFAKAKLSRTGQIEPSFKIQFSYAEKVKIMQFC